MSNFAYKAIRSVLDAITFLIPYIIKSLDALASSTILSSSQTRLVAPNTYWNSDRTALPMEF